MKTKKTVTSNNDSMLLMQYMDQVISGDYSMISSSDFSDPAIPDKFNQMILSIMKSNNNFVMRLNDSMTRIGDSSCVKEMIEQVNSQTTAITDMRDSSQELGASIEVIQNAVQNIQANSHQAIDASTQGVENINHAIEIVDSSTQSIQDIASEISDFKIQTDKITEIIDMVKKIAKKSTLLALNASIEAARAGEAGRGFTVVASQMQELSQNTTTSAEDVVIYVHELQDGIHNLVESINHTAQRLQQGNESVHHSMDDFLTLNKQMGAIGTEIDGIYSEISTQSGLTQSFIASIESITESYHTLSEECVSTGEHLYHISRDIDRARSDMARRNSKLSTLDWITVFEIDHLIFTWRVYNNLADFEQLKLEQLNNPKGCKLGKWLASQTDTHITSSKEFKKVLSTHETVHKYACDSWNAKHNEDRDTALTYFNKAYDAYQEFAAAMRGLEKVIKATGDTEKTDISIFSM